MDFLKIMQKLHFLFLYFYIENLNLNKYWIYRYKSGNKYQKCNSNVVDNWKRDTFVKTHFAKAHRVDSMKLTIIDIISRCLLCLLKIRRRIKKFWEINILWTKTYLLVLKKDHNIKKHFFVINSNKIYFQSIYEKIT